MGPIPSLPSSQSFAPLAPLFPTHALPNARPEPSESRPVGLPSDQVLPLSNEFGSESARDLSRNPAEQTRSAEEKRSRDEPQDKPVEVDHPQVEQQHRSVTYRIHPDLERALQGNVIDADTSEVLKEIPSEERIQLSKAFREHLGTNLDTFA